MKINIFKYFLLLIGFLISLIIYLSIVGIETDKFNQQIKDTVVKSDSNLDVSLKKVKLILDPFNEASLQGFNFDQDNKFFFRLVVQKID